MSGRTRFNYIFAFVLASGTLLSGSFAVTIKGPSSVVRTTSLAHRDTLYVPVSAVAKAWGMYEAEPSMGGVRFFSDRHEMIIRPGSIQVSVDGKKLEMDEVADWVDGKLVVPIYLALIDLPQIIPLAVPLVSPKGNKIRIMLDPGHGGKDPGAVAKQGTNEKDVVLDIAHRTKQLLEAQGLEIVMTRRDDVFISLGNRSNLANRMQADLFVSIHANAAENHLAQGPETFYFSGAGDVYSEYLARLENAGTEILEEILGENKDLTPPDRVAKSRQLAGKVQARLRRLTNSPDRGVKTARFYVIRNTKMPSILVETGFLSNSDELALLGSDSHKQKIAEALAQGIRDYISYGYGRELIGEKTQQVVMSSGEVK